MSLQETREELIDSLQGGLSVLMNSVPIRSVGGDLEEAAGWFQALGICNLLLFADTDRFYENLIHSGHTRRYFLRKSREQANTDDYQLAISRWDSFIDVVAAGSFRLAREIVAASVAVWLPGGEYEDDYLYRLFLHQFIGPPGPQRDAQLHATLDAWRTWLSGQPCTRLDCCVALLKGDSGAFDTAFVDLIAQRQAQVAKEAKMVLAADIAFEPRSRIFIEGLALLRLAQALRFTLRPDYPLCPAIARAAAVKAPPIDIYPEIERERGEQVG